MARYYIKKRKVKSWGREIAPYIDRRDSPKDLIRFIGSVFDAVFYDTLLYDRKGKLIHDLGTSKVRKLWNSYNQTPRFNILLKEWGGGFIDDDYSRSDLFKLSLLPYDKLPRDVKYNIRMRLFGKRIKPIKRPTTWRADRRNDYGGKPGSELRRMLTYNG
jgi:hypothetical protein